jgi:hypothetical protein
MTDVELKPRILVDRPLTNEECELARWILENGIPEAAAFLEQLDRARVVEHCRCGCPTVYFAIEGLGIAPPGVHVLGDFLFGEGDMLSGVFVYEKGGILNGMEVFWFGDVQPTVLPKPAELRPYDKG